MSTIIPISSCSFIRRGVFAQNQEEDISEEELEGQGLPELPEGYLPELVPLVPPPPSEPEPEPPPEVKVEKVPEGKKKSILPWICWPALGVGLGLIGVGGVYHISQKINQDKAEAVSTFEESKKYLDQAKRDDLKSDIFYIAGTVVTGLASGALLVHYLLGSTKTKIEVSFDKPEGVTLWAKVKF